MGSLFNFTAEGTPMIFRSVFLVQLSLQAITVNLECNTAIKPRILNCCLQRELKSLMTTLSDHVSLIIFLKVYFQSFTGRGDFNESERGGDAQLCLQNG